MFTYKELLNLESGLSHLIKMVNEQRNRSNEMALWHDELGELLVKVQAYQEEMVNGQ